MYHVEKILNPVRGDSIDVVPKGKDPFYSKKTMTFHGNYSDPYVTVTVSEPGMFSKESVIHIRQINEDLLGTIVNYETDHWCVKIPYNIPPDDLEVIHEWVNKYSAGNAFKSKYDLVSCYLGVSRETNRLQVVHHRYDDRVCHHFNVILNFKQFDKYAKQYDSGFTLTKSDKPSEIIDHSGSVVQSKKHGAISTDEVQPGDFIVITDDDHNLRDLIGFNIHKVLNDGIVVESGGTMLFARIHNDPDKYILYPLREGMSFTNELGQHRTVEKVELERNRLLVSRGKTRGGKCNIVYIDFFIRQLYNNCYKNLNLNNSNSNPINYGKEDHNNTETFKQSSDQKRVFKRQRRSREERARIQAKERSLRIKESEKYNKGTTASEGIRTADQASRRFSNRLERSIRIKSSDPRPQRRA